MATGDIVLIIGLGAAVIGGVWCFTAGPCKSWFGPSVSLKDVTGKVTATPTGGAAGQALGQNLQQGAIAKGNFLNQGGFTRTNNNITLA